MKSHRSSKIIQFELDALSRKKQKAKDIIAEIRISSERLSFELSDSLFREREDARARKANICTNKFEGLWNELFNSGMTAREVIALRHYPGKLAPLGEKLGVCSSRAREIRNKALRKLAHPSRAEICKKFRGSKGGAE